MDPFPSSDMNRPNRTLAFFVLAYAISWLVWAPLWLPSFGFHGLPVLPFHHALGAVGPIASAFIVATMESGSAGPADLSRRLGLFRGRSWWAAVAVFAPYALLGLSVAWASSFGGEMAAEGFGRSREFPQFSALGFLGYNIVSFGYGEEVGWRGFALPRLQARHSALVASLLLTIGWAIWHLPLFLYRPGYTKMDAIGVVGWLFSLFTGAVLLTWLYNESRGSILVVALFHAAIDVVFTSDISTTSVVNAAGTLITLGGILVVIVAGPRYLSSQGKVIANYGGGAITGFVHRDGEVRSL